MADLTFDAVIIGRRQQGFDAGDVPHEVRRHERGHLREEARDWRVPGHRGDLGSRLPAATPMPISSCHVLYVPLADFPEFWSMGAVGPASMQRWICLPEQQDGVGHLQPEGTTRRRRRPAQQIAPLLQEGCREVDKVGAMEDSREYWRAQADMCTTRGVQDRSGDARGSNEADRSSTKMMEAGTFLMA